MGAPTLLEAAIVAALWPDGDSCSSWSPDTLQAIGEAFELHRPDLIPPDAYDLPPYADEEGTGGLRYIGGEVDHA